MTLDEHNKSVAEIEERLEQEAFDKLAQENGLVPSGEYGSMYQMARYWFALGYEAMKERGRE